MERYFIGNQLFNEYKTCTLQDAIDYLKTQKVVALDIETSRKYPKGRYREDVYRPGLDPYLSRIVMCQIGTLEKRFIIDARIVDLSPLKEILEDETIEKVGANLAFEGMFFLVAHKIRIFNVWDCMIVDRLLYNGLLMAFSLEAMMHRYLGYQSVTWDNLFENTQKEYDDTVKRLKQDNWDDRPDEELEEEAARIMEEKLLVDKSIRLGFINIGESPFTLKQMDYGEDDIVAPLKIREKQLRGRKVGKETYLPLVGIKLENKMTQVLAEIMIRGMDFNPILWEETYRDNLKTYLVRKEFLDDYVSKNHPDFCNAVDLFTHANSCAIEWASSTQVIKLFRKLGLAVWEKSKSTGKMAWTVGAKELGRTFPKDYKMKLLKEQFPEKIENKWDLALAYLMFKNSQQACTTFGLDYLKYIHPITKKIHTSFRQILNSTRMSSTRPNIQQLPQGEEFRRCFVCPPGYKNINTDYASQESRVMADISGAKAMQDFFIKKHPIFGADFHSYTATNMYRIIRNDPRLIISAENKEERDIAKIMGFQIPFGASDYSVSKDLGVSLEEGTLFYDNYFNAFPGLKEYFEQCRKDAVEKGWIQIDAYTDRRYFFPQFERMNELKEFALNHYPEDYRTYSKERKAKFKEDLYAKHPEVKDAWKEWATLKGKLERRSQNFRIQGCAAGMMKLAQVLIYNYRKLHDIWEELYVNNVIHDENNAQALEAKAEEYAKVIEELMVKAGRYFCKTVPMGAESKIGLFWYH
jgi:DNA polymerase I-like protein with 3'-5' exonuclease and polymerase domains